MRWLRRLLWVVLGLVVLLVAAWFAIPPVLSSDWGRRRLAAALTKSLDRPVEVDRLDFGWTTGLVVEGFTLGAGGETALTARELRAAPDLLSLLGSEMRLRRIEVAGVELVVVRDAEGRWSVPALEKLREEEPAKPREPRTGPAAPAPPKEKGESRLARLSVVLAATDVDVRILDARRGEILLPDLEGSATLDPGAAEIPVALGSEAMGFRLDARVRLFEGGRIREAPEASGTLVLTAVALSLYSDFAGLVDGRVGFSGALPGPVEATVDLRARDAAGPGFRVAGEAAVGGKLSFADGVLSSPELSLRLPGAEAGLTEVRVGKEGGAARVEASGTPAALEKALPDVAWPDQVRDPFAADLHVALDGDDWTVQVHSATTVLQDRKLTVFGHLAGDRKLTEVRVTEPLRVIWGEIGARVTGSVADPLGDARKGELALQVSGRLPPEARVEGRVEGEVRLAVHGDNAALSAKSLAIEDLVAGDFEEKRVTALFYFDASLRRRDVEMRTLELTGTGFSATVDGPVRLLPGPPVGSVVVHLLLDHARLRPWLPEGLPLRSAAHDVRVRAALKDERVEVYATDVMSDVVIDGERADSAISVTLRGSAPLDLRAAKVESLEVSGPQGKLVAKGALARGEEDLSFEGEVQTSGDLAGLRRIPALSKLAPSGTWTSRHEVRWAGKRGAAKGRVAIENLALANGFASRTAELYLDAESEGTETFRIVEGLLTTVPASASVYGGEVSKGESGWRFVGRIDAKGDLARLPPGLLPERYREVRSTGRAEARADLAPDGTGAVTVRGTAIEVLGLPEAKGPLRLESARLESRVARGAGERLEVVDPKVTVPAGTIAATGAVRPGRPTDARIAADLDLARLVRDVPGLFPEGLEALGRVRADLRLAGDLGAGGALGMLSGNGEVVLERAVWPGYRLEEGRMPFTLAGSRLEIRDGAARLNGGASTFRGTADLSVDPPAYDLELDSTGVRLSKAMESEARLLAPFFGEASEFSGLLSVEAEGVAARGRGRKDLLQNLAGTVRFSVAEGAIKGSPLLAKILEWLEEKPDLTFASLTGSVVFADGKALTDDLHLAAGNVEIRLAGYAEFEGKIHYAVRVKLPEKASKRVRWLSYVDRDGYLPLGLAGTLSSPQLQPPDVKDVAGGLLDDLLRRALDGAKKKKNDGEKDPRKDGRKKKDRDSSGGGSDGDGGGPGDGGK